MMLSSLIGNPIPSNLLKSSSTKYCFKEAVKESPKLSPKKEVADDASEDISNSFSWLASIIRSQVLE